MEIKGKVKSASADNVSQTMRWAADYYAQHDEPADASLLIVNGWREVPLTERDQLVFPPNIVEDATKVRVGLLTGLQLLGLKLAVQAGELSADDARDKLFGLIGSFTEYEDWTEFLDCDAIDGEDQPD